MIVCSQIVVPLQAWADLKIGRLKFKTCECNAREDPIRLKHFWYNREACTCWEQLSNSDDNVQKSTWWLAGASYHLQELRLWPDKPKDAKAKARARAKTSCFGPEFPNPHLRIRGSRSENRKCWVDSEINVKKTRFWQPEAEMLEKLKSTLRPFLFVLFCPFIRLILSVRCTSTGYSFQ